MSNKSVPKAVADVASGTIFATVDISVPPQRVFQSLTSEEIVQWWGDDQTYHTTSWRADVRIGGTWRAGGVGADGSPFSVEGEYLEVDPPRKLVQTWKPDWDGGRSTTLTYLLEAINGGTRLTVRHEGFGDQRKSCESHGSGWERVLRWLSGYLQPAQPKAGSRFFLCRLIPPRPTFAMDMTPAERAVMQEHVGYWTGHLQSGKAIIFGPVADPKGPWGLGVLRVADEGEMSRLTGGDPAIRSGIGLHYEVLPMVQAMVKDDLG